MTILQVEPANFGVTQLHWIRGLVVLVGGIITDDLSGVPFVPPIDAQPFVNRMIANGGLGHLTATWDDGTRLIQIESDDPTETSTVSYILVW